MATPGKDIAPFLQDNPATSSSGAPDASPNRPQPMKGGEPGADKCCPNRPQPMGAPKGNPQSVPGGGTQPFKGPSTPTQSPFKLGK